VASPRKKRITIIGTGLIGGSLGLALKAGGLPPDVELVGYDSSRGTTNEAEKIGAVDKAEHNIHRAVEGAGLVILATPVLAVREVMEQIAPDLGEGAVVTDTASTKVYVMRWAKELLPEYVSFIGGHPMAGKETEGIQNADGDLFKGKAYCIAPTVDAPETAVRSVLGLIQIIGAEPVFVDPEEHDIYAGAVSHLPLMVSTALFQLIRSSPSWPDMSVMASSGFRDITRLASGDPRMSHDIWVTNRDSVIHWIERMSDELQRLRSLLQDAQDEELLEIFAGARIDRDAFLASPPVRKAPETSDASMGTRDLMMDMLVGGMMGEKLRKMRDLTEEPPETGKKAAPATAKAPDEADEKPARLSLGDRIAEDVRRDLEKMEKKRAEKEAQKQQAPPDS
jgi:prephenate dehydrogenase